jgi:hypothetical protein
MELYKITAWPSLIQSYFECYIYYVLFQIAYVTHEPSTTNAILLYA